MRIIGLLTFLSLFVSSFAWGQETSDYEKKCTAYVQGHTAEFIFPLPKKQIWTWNMKETPDNLLEYTWEVSLTGADSTGTYNFGVSLFKYPNSPEVTGSIAELISTAQTSVWVQSWDQSSSLRDDLIIQSTIQDHKLVIRVVDQKTFSELFSQQPTIAHCRVRTPYDEINYASKTQINFTK